MSHGDEGSDLIEPWLYSTLSTDAGIIAAVGPEGVYGSLVPDDPGPLYVTIALISSRDVRGVGRARIMVDTIYLVKVIGETTSKVDLLPAFRRINALLDGVDRDVPGGHLTCTREATISYDEVDEGAAFLHLGAQLRIRAHTA